MTKITQAERLEAQRELRKLLKPGATVHTILRHCSASGMLRVIDLVIPYTRVDEVSTPAVKAGALREGQRAWITTGPRAFSRATVFPSNASVFGKVALRWPDGHTESLPLADVTVAKTRRTPSLRSIGWLAAKAMGSTFDADRQGIKVSGCGMDMGFHIVYGLGATLWPNGTRKPHGSRNGQPDRDGGYALEHRWL